MGTSFAVTGVSDTMSLVLEDVSDTLVALGCVVCVQDSNSIDLNTFSFTSNHSITKGSRQSVPTLEVDPLIFLTYPKAQCWTSFLYDGNYLGFAGPSIAEIRYTAAQDGCVGFVIDGVHSGYQLLSAASGYARYMFDIPGATCPPFDCATATAVAGPGDAEGTGGPGNEVGGGSLSIPARLSAAQPNPFNPTTTIHFTLDVAGEIELAIHDLSGRRVRELVHERRAAGEHVMSWDGRADDGRELPSGVYFVQLQDGRGEATATQKITLLR